MEKVDSSVTKSICQRGVECHTWCNAVEYHSGDAE